MHRLTSPAFDLPEFRRRLAMAKAGFFDPDDARLPPVLAIAGELPEDMLAPFLLIPHAALEGRPCPSDDALAAFYGTPPPGRVRRLLASIAWQGMLLPHLHFPGKPSLPLPPLRISTASH